MAESLLCVFIGVRCIGCAHSIVSCNATNHAACTGCQLRKATQWGQNCMHKPGHLHRTLFPMNTSPVMTAAIRPAGSTPNFATLSVDTAQPRFQQTLRHLI